MNKFTSRFAVAAALLLGNQCIAQSRVVQSFNADWTFYNAHDSTFFTDLELRQNYIERQSQWTKLRLVRTWRFRIPTTVRICKPTVTSLRVKQFIRKPFP